MQKFGDVVTHTQYKLNDVEFIFPKTFEIEKFRCLPSTEPFSSESIKYLDDLSKILLRESGIKNFPDVVTFAFFCRKANILKMKNKYESNLEISLGRGLLFHIAPSNVPINFAYSLIIGILSGNLNIVRVPSPRYEQIEIVCNAIVKLNKENNFSAFSSRFALVRYDRESLATGYFSSLCDVRIIWGGDNTIEQIRENKLPSRAFDVTFADRYSLCAINADTYVFENAPEKIALSFYNDTYLFDQNACTAPHLVIWIGSTENVEVAKKKFWHSLHELVKSRYKVQSVIAVDKLTSLYVQSINLKNIKKTATEDNLLWRIELEDLPENIDLFRCNSGYFSEYHAESLSDISKIINRKYQTLAYYGIEKSILADFIRNEKPGGIDRIVPVGKTTDFSLIWDGFNLIDTLTRKIEIV